MDYCLKLCANEAWVGAYGNKSRAPRTVSNDGDFVSPPLVCMRGKQVEPKWQAPNYYLTKEEKTCYPTMKIRAQCKPLVEPMQRFNARQRAAVGEIGLDQILHLRVHDIPLRMARWLLENFDPKNMTLRVENGVVIPIEEEDVQVTFGLPRGDGVITKRLKDVVSDTLREWRSLFLKTKHDW